MEINSLTIQSALLALEKKEFSSRKLVSSCLERIKKIDGTMNAFLTVDSEGALLQAEAADKLRAEGVTKPLLGIPIACKDLFTTKDVRTSAGAKIIDSYVPPFEASTVKRLKEAGAIIIGKTNEDAWGHGSSGENSDFGSTKNPYDTTRVPGGSSSGSAAAVASGMCLAATGTDTGSSVRLPAAFCNLVGIKPTYGRVSRYGIIPMASSFDTIGHLTKTVADCALLYEITSGKDPFDGTTADISVPMYTKSLGKNISGLRIGIPKEYLSLPGMQPEVKVVIEEAIKKMESLGAKIVEISLSHTEYAMACYYILVPSEVSSNLSRYDGIRFGHERALFGAEAKRRIMLGTFALSAGYYDAYYKKAAKVRTLIKKDFDDAWDTVDVMLAPSSPAVPFRIGDKTNDPLAMYLSDIFMCPVNIAGVPAINIPCGFVDGLPVGMQFIGPQFSEERLFQIAYAYEAKTEWHTRRPKI